MIAWPAMYGALALVATALLVRPVAMRLGDRWPARAARWGAAVAAVGVLIAVTLAHAEPNSAPRVQLWLETAGQPDAIGVVLLALVGALGIIAPPSTGGRAAGALIGGLTIGAVPTSLILCPQAESPAEAARIATTATAIGLLSPFGSVAALISPAASHLPWIAAAIAGVVASLPAVDAGPAKPTLSGWAAAVGLLVAIAVDRTAGLAIAVVGMGVAIGRPPLRAPEAARILPERAVAAVIAVVGAHIAGSAALLGLTVAQWHVPAALDVVVSAALGTIGDPATIALFLGRAARLDPSIAARAPALALGLAIAPGLAVGVAVHAKGWGAVRYAIVPVIAMIAVALVSAAV